MKISLLIENEPGTMARVMTAVSRFGLQLGGHRLDRVDSENHSPLLIVANGTATKMDLTTRLRDVRGVVEVLGIEAEGADSKGNDTKKSGPTPNSVDVVDQLVSAYPKVLRLIEQHEHALRKNENRNQQMRALGEAVGKKLLVRGADLKPQATISDAIQKVLIPVLKPIARARVDGGNVCVDLSVFTRRQVNTMDLVLGGEASRCDFLTGMIRGMINAVPNLPRARVKEIRCRTNGDPSCVFRVETRANVY